MSLVLLPQEPTEKDFEDWQRRIAYARRHHPELIPKVPESVREARQMSRQAGITPGPGQTYNDIPLAKLEADEFDELFAIFARKLTLAHFYRCFHRPLSRQGGIYAVAMPTPHIGDGKWLDEIVDQLPHLEVPKHGSENLSDQIATRWHASEDGGLGLFVTSFHGSLVIVGMTGESQRWVDFLSERGELDGPFLWE